MRTRAKALVARLVFRVSGVSGSRASGDSVPVRLGGGSGAKGCRARARDGGVRGEREAPRRGLARAQSHGPAARGGCALRGRRRLQRFQRGARLRGAELVAPEQRREEF
jgi:hypothetical protein